MLKSKSTQIDSDNIVGSLFFIVCAPSGTGKTSLCREMLKLFPDLIFSVSCTTRLPRTGEIEGRDYFFINKEGFLEMRDAGEFAEWSTVFDNYYGTKISFIEEAKTKGKDIIFDIDVKGAKQLKTVYPKSIGIFVIPPSFKGLENRLKKRGTEKSDKIKSRLNIAQKELMQIEQFEYIVINDDFSQAVENFKSIIEAERCRKEYILPKVRKNLF
jgi:guanylate kinase